MYTPTGPEILIIEPDPRAAQILVEAATARGLLARSCEDASAAARILADRELRIVVVDETLTSPEGRPVTEYLLGIDPDAQLILTSEAPSLESVVAALRLGVRDLLRKPLADRSAVESALAGAAERLEQRRLKLAAQARLRVEALAAAAVLDRLHLCIVLTDAAGYVKYRNRSAANLLASGRVLREDPEGRLGCARPASQRALRECIASAAEATGTPRAVRLMGHEPGLELGLAAIGVRRAEPGDPHTACVALLLEGTERPLPANSPTMRVLYGLTPAEANVVARLVIGESLQDACDELAITVATGRTHLARAFVKTGTSRQGELISLVCSGPALLVAGAPASERGGQPATALAG